MKKIALMTGCLLLLGSISFAKEEIQCTDSKVTQLFETWEEAQAVCSVYKNTYVSYDHYYKKYTCGCTAPDNGSGE